MKSLIVFVAVSALSAVAVAADRTPPASFSADRQALAPASQIETIAFESLDLDELSRRDARREANGEPVHFAFPHAVSHRVQNSGTWETLGDTSIWRFRVAATDATLINFGFRDVHLPRDARLYIYSPKAAQSRSLDRHRLIGPYGAEINQAHGEFWTPNLNGSEAIIEVNLPRGQRDALRLTLAQVSHGYRGFGRAARDYRQNLDGVDGDGKQACTTSGGARSGACNQDVACLSEDDPWNDPRRSVGAYSRSGVAACTGSLLNNTANDQRMLFVTATHCIVESQAPSIVVYWNYEWPTCRRPGASGGTDVNPPDPNESNSGGTWLAATVNPFTGGGCTDASQCSDMTLIELDDPADPDFDLHWAGWDRRPPPTACEQGPGASTDGLCATIHHPGVDEKRITWVEADIELGDIAAADDVHWHPFWHPNPPELPNMPGGSPATIPPAVTEGGSSGSPLYSADRRMIGVLSGGPAFCGATGSSLSDFYGGLFHAWDGLGSATTRMKDHLDPLGTEPLFIDGIDGEGFDLAVDPIEISQCGFDDVAIEIEATAIGAFTDPVTLSTLDLPAAADATFSTNPVPLPGTSTLTLSDLAAVGSGSFTFSLQGTAGNLTRTQAIDLDLAVASPDTPALIAPPDGATGVATSPTITWQAVPTAVEYALEIATDPGFGNVVYTASESTASHTVTSALEASTTHYVRVRAINACGESDQSTVRSFTTANLICTSPGQPIPDASPDGIDSDLVIAASGELSGLAMTLDISHTYVGDLIITLEHVDTGTSIELVNRADGASATFGCNSSNIQTAVSDDAPLSLQDDCDDGDQPDAYPAAAYRPNDPMAGFSGEDLSGTWRLNVSDNAGLDTGTLNEWCLIPATGANPIIFKDRFEEES
ncbi:MAG: hypothetical protein GVY11_06675 [Gammaproteobacteria bacterium]|jgi:subtilisin-like proprotein convertase family protein|nr:hypothetical protein [Gammaproteobacteria bacterium]